MKGLECAINVPEGVTDDLWLVAGGGASSFTVKVNLAEGDLVRVKHLLIGMQNCRNMWLEQRK